MAAMLNGIAYAGVFRPSGATFLVFADYSRPAMRLAALSRLPVIYIYTHDSVGVGEDGPTHQPVETVAGLRVIPNLDVIRPADPEETAGAFIAALDEKTGPTLLALTPSPRFNDIPAPRAVKEAQGRLHRLEESGPLHTIPWLRQ
jgi:transketolase